MTITVLIADDQPLMRSALRMCLTAEPDLDVVAECADGLSAINLAQQVKPDVALLDIRMPIMDGITATAQLTARYGAKVLLITTFHVDDYVLDALRAGASGFLLKDARPEEIVHAVRVVAAGEALLSPAVTRRLLDRYLRRMPVTVLRPQRVAELTRRELQVLQLVAAGLTNVDIARRLFIAESSVKTHIGHLLAKLECRDRVQLVIFAYEAGVVGMDMDLTD
jgi:DNA-binding NarL/FixJ family response regulator